MLDSEVETHHAYYVLRNGTDSQHISPGELGFLSVHDFVSQYMPMKPIGTVVGIILIIISVLIFIVGIVGNVCVCIVLFTRRYKYLHLDINVYHANLAATDALRLLIALPPEVYTIWEAYPWRFGEGFCIFKAFLLESTSYASVLTITGFTVERYIAICHPIRGQKVSRKSRAVKCIVLIWILSAVCALPYPIHTRTFYFLEDPYTDAPIPDSLLCYIPARWHHRMQFMFQISTFAFFLLPMTIITVMYILIGIRLRKSELRSKVNLFPKGAKSTATRARRAVLRMLVAVVVALFVCWAPFHAQRLVQWYKKEWTQESSKLHSRLLHVSGVLYFLSSTVNPILYNLLSRKFRKACKRTFCRCCLNVDTFPTFYKLKAIFINKNEEQSTSPSGVRYLFPQTPLGVLVDDTSQQQNRRVSKTDIPAIPVSTKDTVVKCTTFGSSTGSHPHSDGRLQCLCRHKSCSSIRTRQSIESNTLIKHFNNVSYHDMETLKKQHIFPNEFQTFDFFGTRDRDKNQRDPDQY